MPSVKGDQWEPKNPVCMCRPHSQHSRAGPSNEETHSAHTHTHAKHTPCMPARADPLRAKPCLHTPPPLNPARAMCRNVRGPAATHHSARSRAATDRNGMQTGGFATTQAQGGNSDAPAWQQRTYAQPKGPAAACQWSKGRQLLRHPTRPHMLTHRPNSGVCVRVATIAAA